MSSIKDPEMERFLYGGDPTQGIINIEYDYSTNTIILIFQHPETGQLSMKQTPLKSFLWTKALHETGFYNGDKKLINKKMAYYGVTVEPLETMGEVRNESGYKYLVKCANSWNDLTQFFKEGGLDVFKDKQYFQYLPPIEQYLVQTGKRLFKGFTNYDDVHRYIFDIETTGLNPSTSRVFMIGAKTTRGFEKLYVVDKENDDESELKLILEWAKDLNEMKPSIVAGYNSENFDFFFLIERLKHLGSDCKEVIKTLSVKYPFKRKEASLKLANEVEHYDQTVIWGINVVDIIHAVRRAQAINSEIKSAGLKYICKFSGIARENRVYIHDGGQIFNIYKENKEYWFNHKNGEYRLCDENPELTDLDVKYPKIYEKVTGEYIVKRYLMDDLWETMEVDSQYNQAAYLMATILPTSFHRVSTMGTAGLWKMLMMAWSYENKLSIPEFDERRDYTGGLSRLLKVGYSEKIVKMDFASLYPSIQITHGVYPSCDISKAMDKMLRFFHATRTECKAEGKNAKKAGNKQLAIMFDRKQLPIKILNNSQYGSLCAPLVFPWSEMDKGEEVTCRGRNYLRTMVTFFTDRKFDPIVLDTDGVNFSYSEADDEYEYTGKGLNWKTEDGKLYKGVEAHCAEFNDIYMRGVMALDIDEIWETTINLARKNYAGLYFDDKGNQKMKLVGNSIKSKTTPTYIEEFINMSFKLLLDPEIPKSEKGQCWIQLYYDYVESIFNKQIPLLKIANKSKVKHTIDEYKKRAKTTNVKGGKLPQLTHMELLMLHNKHANLGDVIYYVNDATKASHGDCGSHKKEKNGEDSPNSYLIDPEEFKKNPDLKGSYNVPRAIAALNKKIKLFTIIFKPEIRDQIIIKEPSERKLFTLNECDLINGCPFDPEDQDDFMEDLMIPEHKEYVFWNKYYQQHDGNIIKELEDIIDPSLPDFDVVLSVINK